MLEQLLVPQLVKTIYTFYGTRRFITVFTRVQPPVPIPIQTNPVLPPPYCFFKIHFNITFQFTSMSSNRSISFRFPSQNHVGISGVLHTCHTPLPICCSLLWIQYTLRCSRWYRSCVHFLCSASASCTDPHGRNEGFC